MLGVMAWRAYYADQCHSSRTHTPSALPRTGLVRVLEYLEPPYRRIVPKGDWYWRDGERWRSSGTGDWGTWLPQPHPDAIRSTSRLPETDYDAIMAALMVAKDVP